MKLFKFLAGCLASVVLPLPILAATLEGVVIGVSDGDTVTVLDSRKQQHKIRLSGIDAPEKSQPFGEESRRSLSDMVFSKFVSIVWEKQDRFGRTVGKILINAQDINLEQIRHGMAWHYKAYAHEQPMEDREMYGDVEMTARKAGQGLWLDPSPIAPWDYRRQRRH